jgi:hypothetical protein
MSFSHQVIQQQNTRPPLIWVRSLFRAMEYIVWYVENVRPQNIWLRLAVMAPPATNFYRSIETHHQAAASSHINISRITLHVLFPAVCFCLHNQPIGLGTSCFQHAGKLSARITQGRVSHALMSKLQCTRNCSKSYYPLEEKGIVIYK